MSDFELTIILFLSHIVFLIYLLPSIFSYQEKNPSKQGLLKCHSKYEETEVKAREPWLYGNGFTKLRAGVQSCWDHQDSGITVTNEA